MNEFYKIQTIDFNGKTILLDHRYYENCTIIVAVGTVVILGISYV